MMHACMQRRYRPVALLVYPQNLHYRLYIKRIYLVIILYQAYFFVIEECNYTIAHYTKIWYFGHSFMQPLLMSQLTKNGSQRNQSMHARGHKKNDVIIVKTGN